MDWSEPPRNGAVQWTEEMDEKLRAGFNTRVCRRGKLVRPSVDRIASEVGVSTVTCKARARKLDLMPPTPKGRGNA
jgi:hypothetical protein